MTTTDTKKNNAVYHSSSDDKIYLSRNFWNLMLFTLTITVSTSLSKLLDYFLVGKTLKTKTIATIIFTITCIIIIYIITASMNIEITPL